MKHLILFSLFLCGVITASAQVKLESGLLISGGTGSMKASLNPPPADRTYYSSEFRNKLNVSIGYRFRLLPENTRFFYDIDLNLGGRIWDYDYTAPLNENPHEDYYYFGQTLNSTTKSVYASLGATVGYKIYKGLSVGAGIEPTYYFYQSHSSHGESNDGTSDFYYVGGNNKRKPFDLPLVGRISYNFRFMEVGLSYKHGLLNTVNNRQIKSGKFSDWQLSLYIPF